MFGTTSKFYFDTTESCKNHSKLVPEEYKMITLCFLLLFFEPNGGAFRPTGLSYSSLQGFLPIYKPKAPPTRLYLFNVKRIKYCNLVAYL
ncbi:hypothetical protein CEXT_514791 [Caerostris extrusa]|uniref:Uncharacterized protein n=1 Tax=Caerostris extrusa TaxID=172846 RepID=A0AAV4SMI3_CAEEX|nr:hypothetical protein CEXT_514791 [Caerostris extrusa]